MYFFFYIYIFIRNIPNCCESNTLFWRFLPLTRLLWWWTWVLETDLAQTRSGDRCHPQTRLEDLPLQHTKQQAAPNVKSPNVNKEQPCDKIKDDRKHLPWQTCSINCTPRYTTVSSSSWIRLAEQRSKSDIYSSPTALWLSLLISLCLSAFPPSIKLMLCEVSWNNILFTKLLYKINITLANDDVVLNISMTVGMRLCLAMLKFITIVARVILLE